MTDKAGNTSADFTEQTFYVDTTAPTLEITGVADRSANNGDIIPVVSYSDTNYDDAQVNITLTARALRWTAPMPTSTTARSLPSRISPRRRK